MDSIGIDMIGKHKVAVAASGMNVEATHIVSV